MKHTIPTLKDFKDSYRRDFALMCDSDLMDFIQQDRQHIAEVPHIHGPSGFNPWWYLLIAMARAQLHIRQQSHRAA